ncbi:MFS transporter [Rhodobacter ferrooxidans]|uniref:Major facilitator superfamily MFS_1 n=1 Tax=Rhodobacter ferrooxidans TaxID=371731 RepID=C8RYU9_9RHOB|nr:MFS transporter [Rhodobacter sp. SW2]EEW26287.1 major facilitator superfamily MFS_1 [Rhodobacter sp. SW2]
MATETVDVSVRSRPMTGEERKVILASSAGTIFEWYDFYLYGSLAAVIGANFFTAFPEATRNVFALLAFAAGFIVRPFGALVFGAMGDLIGRKYTFLATILIMGLSTFCVGLLPGYQDWGVAAPSILIALRMAQGLALGGEYGGAAVYVAEHAPANRRGYYTAFIQTTATLGLLLSLIVILMVQGYVNGNYPEQPVLDAVGAATFNADGSPAMMKAFNAWGWRIPFLGSIFLLLTSLYIRLQMNESPAFQKMKNEGAQSKAPLREAFGQWRNAKIAIIALLGLTAGQAVVWYSGQFYALFFIQNVIKVDSFSANVFVAWSLILGTGGFLFFGSLSDKIGRKPIILTGCLIAAVTYFPTFKMLTKTANPALYAAQLTDVTVTADPEDCSFQFNPTGTAKFTSSCDITKALLSKTAVNSTTVDAAPGTVASVKIGDTVITGYDGTKNAADIKAATEALKPLADAAATVTDARTALIDARKAMGLPETALLSFPDAVSVNGVADPALLDLQAKLMAAQLAAGPKAVENAAAAQKVLDDAKGAKAAFEKSVNDALKAAGYPLVAADNTTIAKAETFLDIFSAQKLTIIGILTYLIILVTMVYGPIAAMLVELFPTRIRYSGLSLPYHIGNGWFGGLLPATAFAISAQSGNIYAGLWYAIVVAVMTVVIGTIFVPGGTHKKSIFADDAKR